MTSGSAGAGCGGAPGRSYTAPPRPRVIGAAQALAVSTSGVEGFGCLARSLDRSATTVSSARAQARKRAAAAASSGMRAISAALSLMRPCMARISTMLARMNALSPADSWMPFSPSQTSFAPSAIAAAPPSTGTALAAW